MPPLRLRNSRSKLGSPFKKHALRHLAKSAQLLRIMVEPLLQLPLKVLLLLALLQVPLPLITATLVTLLVTALPLLVKEKKINAVSMQDLQCVMVSRIQ
jgi:hypothetical protein